MFRYTKITMNHLRNHNRHFSIRVYKTIGPTCNVSHLKPFIVRAHILSLIKRNNICEMNITDVKQVIYSLNVIKDKEMAISVLKVVEKVDAPEVLTLIMKSYQQQSCSHLAKDLFITKLRSKPDLINQQHLVIYLNICKDGAQLVDGYNGFKLYNQLKDETDSSIAVGSLLSLCAVCLTSELNALHPEIFETILTTVNNSEYYKSHPSIISPLLVLCGRLNRIDTMKSLYTSAVSNRTSDTKEIPHMNLLTSLLTGLSYLKEYDQALDLVNILVDDGVNFNAHFMSKIIDVCIKDQKHSKALTILENWIFNKTGSVDSYLAVGILYLLQNPNLDASVSLRVSRFVKRLLLQTPYQLGHPSARALTLVAHLVDSFEEIDEILSAHTAKGNLFDEEGRKILVALIGSLSRKRSWQLLLSLLQRLDTHSDCQESLYSLALSSCVSSLFSSGCEQKANQLLRQNVFRFYHSKLKRLSMRSLVSTMRQAGQARYLPSALTAVVEAGHGNAEVLQDFLLGAGDLRVVLEILKSSACQQRVTAGATLSDRSLEVLPMHVNAIAELIRQTADNAELVKSVSDQLLSLGFDVLKKVYVPKIRTNVQPQSPPN